jgi:hypothetical protein
MLRFLNACDRDESGIREGGGRAATLTAPSRSGCHSPLFATSDAGLSEKVEQAFVTRDIVSTGPATPHEMHVNSAWRVQHRSSTGGTPS